MIESRQESPTQRSRTLSNGHRSGEHIATSNPSAPVSPTARGKGGWGMHGVDHTSSRKFFLLRAVPGRGKSFSWSLPLVKALVEAGAHFRARGHPKL